MAGFIDVRGAREHNLKNVDVRVPRDQFTVITGISGSGKSSLAFDTIYAEGQRRYVESLSAYARQFLELAGKPDVDQIEGLSPAIAIEQKTTSHNPRSTVGTVTEIHDYMRLLWARVGVPYSPATGLPIEAQTVSQMVDRILAMPHGTRLMLLAPVARGRKGEYRKELAELARKGFTRAKVDGTLHEIADVPALNRKLAHDIEAVVDRVVVRPGMETRLADSIEIALGLSEGLVYAENVNNGERTIFSSRFACPVSGFSIAEIEPRLFSFNSPHGACPACDGLGVESFFDPALVVPDERLCIARGAIAPWAGTSLPYYGQTLQSLARHLRIRTATPWRDLPEQARQAILFGTGEEVVAFAYKDDVRSYTVRKPFEGVLRNLERRFAETDSAWVREELTRYRAEKPCAVCHGARLKPEALAVKVAGKNIAEASVLPIRAAQAWFSEAAERLSPQRAAIARRILREIVDRLQFLIDVGLDYLTLARGSATLSGGEGQRIRLASQIGSGLTGVLYVLDEPSIGLHQRDNARLLATLGRLKRLGNTVLVVEHDAEAMRAADHLIDMGPGAGLAGGEVIAEGRPEQVEANPRSLTGAYLAGRERIEIPAMRRPAQKDRAVRVIGARGNNLKNITSSFPICIFR
ncbi:MAG: excinuclease ABC subunit UvrA [Stellaceae bacterium]